jgi:hypothetical protein
MIGNVHQYVLIKKLLIDFSFAIKGRDHRFLRLIFNSIKERNTK